MPLETSMGPPSQRAKLKLPVRAHSGTAPCMFCTPCWQPKSVLANAMNNMTQGGRARGYFGVRCMAVLITFGRTGCAGRWALSARLRHSDHLPSGRILGVISDLYARRAET